MPISVFLFSVFGPISDLLLLIQYLSKNIFWGKEANNLGFFWTSFFKKHYKNRFCLDGGCLPSTIQKPVLLIVN